MSSKKEKREKLTGGNKGKTLITVRMNNGDINVEVIGFFLNLPLAVRTDMVSTAIEKINKITGII